LLHVARQFEFAFRRSCAQVHLCASSWSILARSSANRLARWIAAAACSRRFAAAPSARRELVFAGTVHNHHADGLILASRGTDNPACKRNPATSDCNS
jgi:hypothetical protein